MKSSQIVVLLLLLPIVALWGCEGEQGPAGLAGADGADGTDGIDGVDGNVTCLECHDTATMAEIGVQYGLSHHAAGLYVDYTASKPYYSSCMRCHNGEGYVEYQDTGETSGVIQNPVAIGCDD